MAGPVTPSAAGEVRYYTVIRGKKGKVSIRTYGRPGLRIKVTHKAPATTGYQRFTRTATYTRGRRNQDSPEYLVAQRTPLPLTTHTVTR